MIQWNVFVIVIKIVRIVEDVLEFFKDILQERRLNIIVFQRRPSTQARSCATKNIIFNLLSVALTPTINTYILVVLVNIVGTLDIHFYSS